MRIYSTAVVLEQANSSQCVVLRKVSSADEYPQSKHLHQQMTSTFYELSSSTGRVPVAPDSSMSPPDFSSAGGWRALDFDHVGSNAETAAAAAAATASGAPTLPLAGIAVLLFSHRPTAAEAEGGAGAAATTPVDDGDGRGTSRTSTSSSSSGGRARQRRPSSSGCQIVALDAIFGIYSMLSGPFVALVLESERRVTGCGALDFRKATKIALVPLFATGRTLTAQQQKDEDRYLDLLRGAFAAVSFRHVALPHCPQC